jgi:hypothetical protein
MIDKTENDRKLYADAVISDMAQLKKLLDIDPPLGIDELAHRLAWPRKELKKMLKMMRIER